jgi:hypothetical protein
MLNSQQFRRVVDDAVAIVIVADRAVQHVIAQDAIKRFHLGRLCLRCLRGDFHSVGDCNRAGANQAAVLFNHAGIASLNRPPVAGNSRHAE